MKDFSEIREKIAGMAPGKQVLATKLLSKVEFMDAQLEELQNKIEKKGWSEKYQNGANQFGIKKSTEGDVYNTLIKNYTTALRNLNDMIPDEEDEVDALAEFNQ